MATTGNPASITLGSTVRMDVQVKNTGTSPTTFYVGCTLAKGTTYVMDFDMRTVTLDPGMSSVQSFTATVIKPMNPGMVNASFGIWPVLNPPPGTRSIAYLSVDDAFNYS